nr:tudor domain-containing protein 7 isoform X1 [Onthophagus taurus]
MGIPKEDIITNIRACLVSNKGQCTLRQLHSDYKTLIGCEIDYKSFKFRSLEDFLKSLGSFVLTQTNGQTFVTAKVSEKSEHVVDLVSRQRGTKKKRVIRQRSTQTYNRFQQSKPTTRWRPKYYMEKDEEVDKKRNATKKEFVLHRQYVTMGPNDSVCVENNNKSGVQDLRQVLNDRKKKLEPQKSLKVFSEKTNINKIMAGFTPNTNINGSGDVLKELKPKVVNFDSWTSSEGEEVIRRTKTSISDKQKKLEFTGDSIIDLDAFTKHHKLPSPQYTIVKRPTKYPPKILYDCKLKIGDQVYSNYPQEFRDENTLRLFVSSVALEDLKGKQEKRASLLISADQDVLERIPELVKKHYHGIWNSQIELDYTDLYKEALPLNWVEVVDKSPMICVEKVSETRYVLRCCKPEDMFQKGKPIGLSAYIYDVSVPTNVVHFGNGGDAIIMAEITCVVSAREIWCRQLETDESEAFDLMVIDFNRTYENNKAKKRPIKISEGGYYAIFLEVYHWCRVRVIETNGSKINCFLIDYGDELEVDEEQVFLLDPKFARRQAQAFVCRLAGLEELYEVSAQSSHIQDLWWKMVQLETENIESAVHDPTAAISAVFYDVETNESINKRLISDITFESANPVLDKMGITEVTITYITDLGDVFVNIVSPGLDRLNNLLKDLEVNIKNNPPRVPNTPFNRDTALNKLFFVCSPRDGRFYRVQAVDFSPKNDWVQLFFVDKGFCEILKVVENKFYPLELLNDVINQFPGQAIKVKLELKRIPEHFQRKLREIVPEDFRVLLKVVGEEFGEDNCSYNVVKLFKRVGDVLCLVNESISFDDEQLQRSMRSTPERLQRLLSVTPSSGNLMEPVLPKLDEFFDVQIPTAVNPWNFFVQPYSSKLKLDEMMQNIQAEYEKANFSPLQLDDVNPGKIYASKFEDGKWYRTSIMKVINSSSISVFYCDFGYYSSVSVNQLFPLNSHFLQLPCQAIKAKLYGIAPKQSKWTVNDCTIFQEMVCRKAMVSKIKAIEKDELYQCDNVLLLELIDTTTDVDVYIDRELIRKGVAVKRV